MNGPGPVVVIGGGGHAKVVISTLRAVGHEVAAVFDDDPAKRGRRLLGVEVAGPIAAAADQACEWGVIAIGENRTRRAIVERVGLRWVVAIHPRAYVDPTATIGPGTVVFAGAIIQADATVAAHAIVNSGAIVEHDCRIGRFAHVAPGSRLAGGVTVGEGTLIGIGATLIPGVRVGEWATVGAGSVVVRDLPDRVVAFGVPARPGRLPGQ